MRGIGIDIRVVATIIRNVPSFGSFLILMFFKIIGISEISAVVFAALESMLALSVELAIAIANANPLTVTIATAATSTALFNGHFCDPCSRFQSRYSMKFCNDDSEGKY